MVLTLVQLTSAYVLLSAIDCLEFSRVLCESPSSYFICDCPIAPWHTNTPCRCPDAPPPQVQASSDHKWYYCRSAWHIISLWVRVMFYQMYLPRRCIWWPRVVQTEVWFTWTHVLLSAIYCLDFTGVLWNTLSEFFICNPQCPWHPYTPLSPDMHCICQEFYYYRSAWHVISLLVSLIFCQMFPITTGIWWPRAVLHKVNMTCGYPFGQADLSSDVPFATFFPEHFWFLMRRLVLHK